MIGLLILAVLTLIGVLIYAVTGLHREEMRRALRYMEASNRIGIRPSYSAAVMVSTFLLVEVLVWTQFSLEPTWAIEWWYFAGYCAVMIGTSIPRVVKQTLIVRQIRKVRYPPTIPASFDPTSRSAPTRSYRAED